MENILNNSIMSNTEIFNGEDLTKNEMSKNLDLIGIKHEKYLKRNDMVKKYNEIMSSEENRSKLASMTSKSNVNATISINDFKNSMATNDIISNNNELVDTKSKEDSKSKSISITKSNVDDVSTSNNTHSIPHKDKNEIESISNGDNLLDEIQGNQEYELNITRNSLQLLADNHDSSYVYKYEKIYRNKSFPEKKTNININDLDKDNINGEQIQMKPEDIEISPNEISSNTISALPKPKKVMFTKKQVPFTPSIFSISNNEINFDSKVTKNDTVTSHNNTDTLKGNMFNVKEATINNYTNFLISDENSRFAHLKYISNNRHLLPKLGKELKNDSIYNKSFDSKQNDESFRLNNCNCTNQEVILKMNSRTNSLNNTIDDIEKNKKMSNDNKNFINNLELKQNKRLYDIKLPLVKEMPNDDTSKKFNNTFNVFSSKDNQGNEFIYDANSYYDHIAGKYPDTKRKYLSYSISDNDIGDIRNNPPRSNEEFMQFKNMDNVDNRLNQGNQLEYLKSPCSQNSKISKSESDSGSNMSKELTKSFSDKLNLSVKSERSFRELKKLTRKSNGEYSQQINESQNESALRVLQENANTELNNENNDNQGSKFKGIMAGIAIVGTLFAGKLISDNHENINSYFQERLEINNNVIEKSSPSQINDFFYSNWHFIVGFIIFLILFKLTSILLKALFKKR